MSSWYRTHRPRQVSQLDLSNVRQTLQQFMEQGHIPQVLLFAGPKGTGKTSSARIIGAMLNDEVNDKVVDHQFFGKAAPADNSYQEPDPEAPFNQQIYRGQSYVVQEMDAASNRGIDDIRMLKERVSLPPQQAKMTVYILDEAHMLTTAAFNALLKLLEEPPAHVVFILATTELHKIPATIKSRCSIIHFRKASHEEITASLTKVLTAEDISYQHEALDLIAERADGSFRDAVKMLEMVVINDEVTLDSVEQVLSASASSQVQALIQDILDKDPAAVAALFEELRANHVDEQYFYSSVLNYLHHSLLQSLQVVEGSPELDQKVSLFLLKELSLVEQTESPIAHLHLELKVLELIQRASNQSGGSKKISAESKTKQTTVTKTETKTTVEQNPQTAPSEVLQEFSGHGDSKQLLKNWSELLAAVKERNMTLEALLRSAKPVKGVNGTAEVAVYYQFHKEQLEQPKFQAMIDECAAPLAGGKVKIRYVLSKPPEESTELTEATTNDQLAALAEEVLV